jgi:two-component system, OmpR family, response regulator
MMKILFAEDDSNIAMIAKITLERIGKHTVVLVTDGKAALDLALKENFDLILLDGMMPIMDGVTVLKNIKTTHASNIPVIFLSAKSQEADIKEVIALGAIGYIHKPFEPKTLCEQIDQILAKKAVA